MVLRVASILLCLVWALPSLAMDQVTLRRDNTTLEATGKVLILAQDGGLVLLARDGVLWLIQPQERVAHTTDDVPFTPLARDEMTKRVLAELPPGFKVHPTAHYLIFYDTSSEYAKWCGSLFEKLYTAFTNYWTRSGFELTEPPFPLVAIVFADKDAYLKFSRPDLGEAGESVAGYFGLLSNRMTMYDLTGVEARGHARTKTTAAQINQILSQPAALHTVATIVHEATHQIAFNCGLHTRLSDCPRWFSEGIAEYFETPNLSKATGWGGIKKSENVNWPRLTQFLQYLRTRPTDSLETLLREDGRFTDPKRALDAYAEAWALTYFLMHQHPKEYIAYLRILSTKKPLMSDSPEQRINDFRKAFGELPQVETEFRRFIARFR